MNFERRRGSALGMLSALGGSGMALVPLVLSAVIASRGWRASSALLGLVVCAALLPIARWLVRDPRRPFRGPAGQQPLGDAAPSSSAGLALRHPAFWLVTLAVGLSALVGTALVFHQIALLGERGLSPARAAANLVPQSIATAAGALLAGRLADRLPSRALVPPTLALLATASLLLQHVGPNATAVLYAVALGTSGGAIRTLEGSYLPRWFGIAAIGQLRGIIMSVAVGGSAVGPFLLAASADRFGGGYAPMLTTFAAAATLLGAASLWLPTPAAHPSGAAHGTSPPRHLEARG